MANNPFSIDILSGQQGINQSLAGLGNTLGGLGQQRELEQQQEAQQMRLQEGAQKYQQAISSGDIGQISSLMLEYPELQQTAERAFGFSNDQSKQIASDIYTQAYLNPDLAPEILAQGAQAIEQAGGQPVMTLQDAQELQGLSPSERKQRLGIGIASVNPELAKQLQSQEPKPLTEYQKIQTNLRQAELEEKNLDRQLKRETNELRRQELESQIAANKAGKETIKQEDQVRITDAIQDAQTKQSNIDDLLQNDDYIDSLTGYRGRSPALTDSGLEAEAYLDNIKNSMTIENLGVMSGPLTDKDIQIIASASSRLRAGMSDKALKKELRTIRTAYDRVINNFNKEANRKGYSLEGQSPLAGKGPRSEADILKQYGIE
jgi:hypothetical protein